jgi:heavy metal sensor kinase
MSLTARLSAFFLGALAVVLLGFSTTLYLLARTYLERQVNERLTAALDTLVAAVEIEPDGLDWEPAERRLSVGVATDAGEVRWLLRDGAGRLVDHSANLDARDPLTSLNTTPAEGDRQSFVLAGHAGDRLVLQQQIHHVPGAPAAAAALIPGQPERSKHRDLVLTAALSRAPTQATVQLLGLTLGGLSCVIWLVAAGLGRWFCRRALAPVTQMAATARSMSDADWDQRLPLAPTGDELEDLGRAFNDLLARLQDAFERQRRFTGDASHQLRTPLTAVLGQLDVVMRRDRSMGEYKLALQSIREQALKLREIVETLLFLARADGEARLPQAQEIDLTSWLAEYRRSWANHPRAEDLHYESEREGITGRVSEPLLEQMLGNLLDNACKYSNPGTPITVRLGRSNGRVTCTVEDEGFGIATEDLPHLAEPFFRSADARRRGCAGIGLGLTVVQRVAVAVGGSLQVASSVGKGSRFTLAFPEAERFPVVTEARSPAERGTAEVE